MKKHRAKITAFFAAIAILCTALVASAQARVVIQVRTAEGSPSEAEVTLVPEQGGPSHSCRTSGGTCTIPRVPGGRYIVTATPTGGGEAPLPRRVPIPPTSEITISVTLR
jgi:hypothetical protein